MRQGFGSSRRIKLRDESSNELQKVSTDLICAEGYWIEGRGFLLRGFDNKMD